MKINDYKKIIAIFLFMFCLLPSMYVADGARWTYPISIKLLQSRENQLINRDNLLSSDYVPIDLINSKVERASSAPIQISSLADKMLVELFDAARKDDCRLFLKSGYRSYKTQKTMYGNRLEKNNGSDDGIVQYPGASEHQSGLAADVINAGYVAGKRMNEGFGDTKEGKWLKENCHKFGFVIRYEKAKENITKIKYEPWHLRYVGVEIANYMHDKDLSHEEFDAEWHKALDDYIAAGGSISKAIADENLRNQPQVQEIETNTGETEISISFQD